MLEEQFPDILPLIAVGFVGSGSEKFGFDDEISRDHDFEAGFSIFLPGEDKVDRRTEFKLERAYSKLPREFEGVVRPILSPVGGNRCGPVRRADFLRDKLGSPDGELDAMQWLTIPDHALSEASNGEIFFDGDGVFGAIREKIKNMPEDVRRKRIAGNLLMMAQSGQYNFERCSRRGEYEAAQLAADIFCQSAIKVLFLLKHAYAPYYKWSFRALREIESADIVRKLSDALMLPCTAELSHDKYLAIEDASGMVISRLRAASLTDAVCGDLEKHAYSVNDGISDGTIRNLNIMISI